jgi:hypothetical protein
MEKNKKSRHKIFVVGTLPSSPLLSLVKNKERLFLSQAGLLTYDSNDRNAPSRRQPVDQRGLVFTVAGPYRI